MSWSLIVISLIYFNTWSTPSIFEKKIRNSYLKIHKMKMMLNRLIIFHIRNTVVLYYRDNSIIDLTFFSIMILKHCMWRKKCFTHYYLLRLALKSFFEFLDYIDVFFKLWFPRTSWNWHILIYLKLILRVMIVLLLIKNVESFLNVNLHKNL